MLFSRAFNCIWSSWSRESMQTNVQWKWI